MFINRSTRIFHTFGMLTILYLLIACQIKENAAAAACVNCYFEEKLDLYQVYHFFSPDYPAATYGETYYSWDIEAPEKHKVHMNCTVNMDNNICLKNRIHYYANPAERSIPPTAYCGHSKFEALSAFNQLRLVYRSLENAEPGKFACSVMAVPA